jgi:hypothetical protein
LPASSGKTERHRSTAAATASEYALWRIVLTCMRSDERTCAYVKHSHKGKSKPEHAHPLIRRRETYRYLLLTSH